MRVDDLSDERCEFTETAPDIPPQEIHLVIWQRTNSPEPVTSLEPLESLAPFTHPIINTSNATLMGDLANTAHSANVPIEGATSGECFSEDFFDEMFGGSHFTPPPTDNSQFVATTFDPADLVQTPATSLLPVPHSAFPLQTNFTHSNGGTNQTETCLESSNMFTKPTTGGSTGVLPSFDDSDLSFLDEFIDSAPAAVVTQARTVPTAPRIVEASLKTDLKFKNQKKVSVHAGKRKLLSALKPSSKSSRKPSTSSINIMQTKGDAGNQAKAQQPKIPDIQGTLQHLKELEKKDQQQSDFLLHLLQHRTRLSDSQISSARSTKTKTALQLDIPRKNEPKKNTEPLSNAKPALCKQLSFTMPTAPMFQGYQSERVLPRVLKGKQTPPVKPPVVLRTSASVSSPKKSITFAADARKVQKTYDLRNASEKPI